MRTSFRCTSAGLALLAAAACSDLPSTGPAVPSTRSLSAEQAPAFDYTAGGAFEYGDTRTNFIVGPSGGSFVINGLFTVSFPDNSICDPSQSSYGEGTWDSPCVTLSAPIAVSATARLENGKLAVDFQPALRFSPSARVFIYTDLFAPTIVANRRYYATHLSSLSPLALLYAPSLDAVPVEDYLTDESLVTHVDLRTGRVWRRVKHFSGYMGGSGEACTPSPDNPDCVWVDDGHL